MCGFCGFGDVRCVQCDLVVHRARGKTNNRVGLVYRIGLIVILFANAEGSGKGSSVKVPFAFVHSSRRYGLWISQGLPRAPVSCMHRKWYGKVAVSCANSGMVRALCHGHISDWIPRAASLHSAVVHVTRACLQVTRVLGYGSHLGVSDIMPGPVSRRVPASVPGSPG